MKTKEMSNKEFAQIQSKARNSAFSKFGQFAQDMKGLEVYRQKKRVYAYQLFHYYHKKSLNDLIRNPYYELKSKNYEQ